MIGGYLYPLRAIGAAMAVGAVAAVVVVLIGTEVARRVLGL